MRESQPSESSAATRVIGSNGTWLPASPAVGRGAVGLGLGCWAAALDPHDVANTIMATHDARRTVFKFLCRNGLVTVSNIDSRSVDFKKRASVRRPRRSSDR